MESPSQDSKTQVLTLQLLQPSHHPNRDGSATKSEMRALIETEFRFI